MITPKHSGDLPDPFNTVVDVVPVPEIKGEDND